MIYSTEVITRFIQFHIVRSGNGCVPETGRCPSSRCQMDPADPHQADPTDAVRCIGRLVIGTAAFPAPLRASDSLYKASASADWGRVGAD